VSGHASFDPDEAWRYVYKTCGNLILGNFLTQNDRAFLIQANHMQRVLAGIDTDCAENCDVFLASIKTPERGDTAIFEIVWKGIHARPLQTPTGNIPALRGRRWRR
jgi:hypothetical protein